MTIIITKSGHDRIYDLESFGKDVISFGRSRDCDITLEKKFVSRVHGCFFREKGKWFVQDLESRNGVMLNHKKIIGPCLLDFISVFQIINDGDEGEIIEIKAA